MISEKTSLPQGPAAVEEQSVNEQEVRGLFQAGEEVSRHSA